MAMAIAAGISGTAMAAESSFTDIPKDHWSYAAVDQLVAFGIIPVRKSLRYQSYIAFSQRIGIVSVAADVGDAVADEKQFPLGRFLHKALLIVLDDFGLIAIRIGDEVISY